MTNIIQAFPKGSGGGGGHTILDSSGTAVAQESNLQFTGLSVTDDSVNRKTEVAGEGLNAESINDIAEANSTVPAIIIGDANNYSTSEKVVGKWIDGKPIYQKTIDCGTLPNNTYKDIPSGLSNITIINMYGMSKATNDGAMIPIPRSNNGNANTDVDISYRNDNKIRLITQMDLSVFDWTYVTLQYTKTTD